ncbi:MAG: hypothetical protein KC416_00210, partial [Myxococcales bacterium]|nr:hypothetical protein [Myxococcales bacterium]
AGPDHMSVTAPPPPTLATGAASRGSDSPRRVTIPTPYEMKPPVLVLSSSKDVGLMIRAALGSTNDVVSFEDSHSLLRATDDLASHHPIVVLDGRDGATLPEAQQALALVQEDLRVITWGWSLDDEDAPHRTPCDASAEPEDIAYLVRALMTT